jgi:hypothetical protein
MVPLIAEDEDNQMVHLSVVAVAVDAATKTPWIFFRINVCLFEKKRKAKDKRREEEESFTLSSQYLSVLLLSLIFFLL